ncbi:uncharacterized protein G2W53_039743 [Senna tora]|uniref:Uncharacterized protein n=1 Tax=Senna tora TaxID=362788 RepID=A0A834SQ12_9FABA|nr:uncharacterized protein G2W53_039743 [Senna tora]
MQYKPYSSIKTARIPKYNAKRSNVFIQDLKHLSCEHEPHPSNKTARIPKYNAKRSIFNAIMSPIRALNPLGFPNTMRRRSEPYPNIKSTRIPIYNAKRPF